MNKTIWLRFGGVLLAVFMLILVGFSAAEPGLVVGQTQATSTFTVTQTVTSEIAFAEEPADVIMQPSLGGLTGGTSTGSTTVRVVTNDQQGYNMTLTASTTVPGHAMTGYSQGGYISDFRPTASTVPAYLFTTAANTSAFGYTVSASTTADLAQQFRDNGSSLCNISGGSDTGSSASCWADASTTARTIINRSSETAASGSTSTIAFKVVIRSSPVPAVPEDTYVATMTLTATVN